MLNHAGYYPMSSATRRGMRGDASQLVGYQKLIYKNYYIIRVVRWLASFMRVSWDIRKSGGIDELGPFASKISADKGPGPASACYNNAYRGVQEGFHLEAFARC